MTNSGAIVRIAAVGDLHCTAASKGSFQRLFAQINDQADILALCGDLTQAGQPAEAKVLADELTQAVRIPAVAVLGNHDVECSLQGELCRILEEAGVRVLDGQSCQIHGLGFAGTKGFGGGFHGKLLVSWGEPIIKQFVREAVNEARKLDAALAQLHTPQKLVLLHYSPIRATVANESPEIFPFVGSSHLETPLNRHNVTAAFHGHAHHGSPEGRTTAGVPVFNVSEPLMKQLRPARPFALIEVPVTPLARPAPASAPVLTLTAPATAGPRPAR